MDRTVGRSRFIMLAVGTVLVMSPGTMAYQECAAVEVAVLQQQDTEDGIGYGESICLDGDYAVVGAPTARGFYLDTGCAYVYHRQGARWVEESRLLTPDGAPYGNFGMSVAMADDRLLISGAGGVYVFERSEVGWVDVERLSFSDAQPTVRSMAVSGDVVVCGVPDDETFGDSSGAVYVFRWNGSQWEEEAKLYASDAEERDFFGDAVDVSGDYIIVGAYMKRLNLYDAGAAYIFRYESGQWLEESKFLPGDLQAQDKFGCSVAISENLIAVGSRGDSPSGSVYVGVRSETEWVGQAKIRPNANGARISFGSSVDISGQSLVIGAPKEMAENDYDEGVLYQYELRGQWWREVAKIGPRSGLCSYDDFGATLATDGRHVMASARLLEDPWYKNLAYILAQHDGPFLMTSSPCGFSTDIRIWWQCATPAGRVALLYAPARGALTIPDGNPCAGTVLALGAHQVRVISSLIWSDEAGDGVLTGSMPSSACGGYLQLVDFSTCVTSNIVRIE
ncbi:MAG: hypothetical protein D8M59_10275 [Planctomycetes bacterium]|nr:hypothetical protein [Planctomycetota bacterium]NOG55229.1 hypothetical protein [Planctomycetota bacterium]